MSINSTNRVAGPFSGSGTAATFPFAFKVFQPSDLYVVQLTTASGAIAVLQLTADYTVALNADQDSSPGGTITLTTGNLAPGLTLTITTDMAALQGVDLTNAGAFYPDVINAALDTLTILVQQLLVRMAMALQMPLPDAGAVNVTLPPAAERAGNLLAFDAGGNVLLIPMTGVPAGAVPTSQAASGAVNGANKTFTFVAAAATTPTIMVFAGGVYQTPGGDYGAPTYVAGTTWQIVFVNAPTRGPVTVALFA